jgi:uncharacterized protein
MRGEGIVYNVPVFPLNAVLFPSMPLRLHVFEERYRTMIEDLRRGDNRFCAALIRDGVEVGGDAEPCEIACLAEIVQLEPLPDGRFFLLAVGVERVRILSIDRGGRPYLTGSLEMWPDESANADPALVATASRLFTQYMDYIRKLVGGEHEKIPVPAEPDLLSHLLAMTVHSEPAVRQRLLELPGSEQRLKTEVEMLHAEIPILRALANSPEPPGAGFGQFSAN